MEIITLTQEAVQTTNVTLNQQDCTIKLYQMPSMLYIDLMANNNVIMLGIPCSSFTKLVRYGYLGFQGDLFFVDYDVGSQPIEPILLAGRPINTSSPNFAQLGTRFELWYVSPEEL